MVFIDSGATGRVGRLRGWATAVASGYAVSILAPSDASREPALAVSVSLLVSSTSAVNTDVRVEASVFADFSTTMYANTLTNLTDGVAAVTISGLVDLTQYWLRARAAETGTTGWSPWQTLTFTVDLNAGRANQYVSLNVGPAPWGPQPSDQYVDLNVGVIFPATFPGQQYVDLNVGFYLALDGLGYGYAALGDVNTLTPTPHIWFVRPAAGRPGDGIRVIGWGFGDLPATYSGVLEEFVGGVWEGVSVTVWQTYPASSEALTETRTIDVVTGTRVDPQHTEIEFVVAAGLLPPGVVLRVRTEGP